MLKRLQDAQQLGLNPIHHINWTISSMWICKRHSVLTITQTWQCPWLGHWRSSLSSMIKWTMLKHPHHILHIEWRLRMALYVACLNCRYGSLQCIIASSLFCEVPQLYFFVVVLGTIGLIDLDCLLENECLGCFCGVHCSWPWWYSICPLCSWFVPSGFKPHYWIICKAFAQFEETAPSFFKIVIWECWVNTSIWTFVGRKRCMVEFIVRIP